MGNRSSARHYDPGAAARIQQQRQQLQAMRLQQQRRQQEKERTEKEARELAAAKEEQERKIEEEKRSFELDLQKQKEQYAQAKRDGLQTALGLKIKMMKQEEKKTSKLKKRVSKLSQENARQIAEIQSERQRLGKLNFKEVENGHVLVLLGKTGVGKSTFTNRIYGDTSKKANEGPAKTSSSTASCTTAPQIVQCNFRNETLHVVDSGGFADTEGRDAKHANNLCEFLNGCGGINAFVLLLNSQEPRITSETINALLDYENIFGTVMYKQLVVVATRVDEGDNLEDYEEDEIEVQLRNTIVTKLKLREKGFGQGDIEKLPVIPIGRRHYKPALDQLSTQLQTRIRQKFGTSELRSPLEEMQSKHNELISKCQKEESDLEDCAQVVANLRREIEGLKKALDEGVLDKVEETVPPPEQLLLSLLSTVNTCTNRPSE